jgi:hypothetical protein
LAAIITKNGITKLFGILENRNRWTIGKPDFNGIPFNDNSLEFSINMQNLMINNIK